MGYQDSPREDLFKVNSGQQTTPNHGLVKNFHITFPTKVMELKSYTTSCDIPAVDLGKTDIAGLNNFNFQMPGNSKTFAPFYVNFLVDEFNRAYTIIYEWISANKDQVEGESDEIARTIVVEMYDNSFTKVVGTWTFWDAFPGGIGGISYDYGTLDSDSITIKVPFIYSHSTYEGIQKEDIDQYKA